jgi:hypothetical protein
MPGHNDLALVAIAGLVATACQGQAPTRTLGTGTTFVDTVISAESGLLNKPADITVTPDGGLLILDYGKPSIVEITDAGGIGREWGHAGSGPGELLIPLGLASRGDTLFTTNVGNARFEIYLRSGEVLPSRPAPAEARYARLAMNPDGGYILPTNGQSGSLAGGFNRDGSLAFSVGQPVVPPSPQFDLGGFRQAALHGEVPDYYRNGALVALAEDSTLWLAMNTEGTIARYSVTGQLLGQTTIDDSLFPAIRSRYIQRNKDDSTGRRVYPLYYFADLQVESGRLWILLNAPPDTPAVVLRLGSTGEVERRFRLPGITDVWRMAVRPTRRELLFTSAETATLFRASMSKENWENTASE